MGLYFISFMSLQMNDFLRQNTNLGSAKRAFEQAAEKTLTNILWISKNEGILKDWLKGNEQIYYYVVLIVMCSCSFADCYLIMKMQCRNNFLE